MSVRATYDYHYEPKDKVENFNGMQLLYVYWPKHLMFCAPFALLVSPQMSFAEVWQDIIVPAIELHPESRQVALDKVEWRLNGEVFTPSLSASLADNGIDHKSLLTMATPGLEGMANAGY